MSNEDGQKPSLCAQSVPLCPSLPAGRVRRNVTGEGKSVRSCDGTWLGASQNNHHYWRSGDVRWRYPSSLMPAVRGTWQVTGAYQGEPSPGTDGGGGRGTHSLGGGVRAQHGLRPQRDRAARARPLPASERRAIKKARCSVGHIKRVYSARIRKG